MTQHSLLQSRQQCSSWFAQRGQIATNTCKDSRSLLTAETASRPFAAL